MEEKNYDPVKSKHDQRRKDEWKYAKRHYHLLRDKYGVELLEHFKPIHYYSKTKPEAYYQRCNKTNNKGKHRNAYGNYNPAKNWSTRDKRTIENFNSQMEELTDGE